VGGETEGEGAKVDGPIGCYSIVNILSLLMSIKLFCFSVVSYDCRCQLVMRLLLLYTSHCCTWQGYTNADNPFGDEHLLDTFVWQKKLEKEGKSDLAKTELEKIQKTKMMESKVPVLYITAVLHPLCVGNCTHYEYSQPFRRTSSSAAIGLLCSRFMAFLFCL